MKILIIKLTIILSIISSMSANAFWGPDKKTIKIAHYFNEQHPQHIALKNFEKEVEQESNGEIDVKIFPNAQLGAEEQEINGVRNGTIEIALFGSLMQNLDPRLGFFETPFLIRDYDHAKKVLRSNIGEDVAKIFEDYGVKHLAYTASGFRVISSNKKIEKPEDYKGVRMRIPNVAMFVEMANLLGVNPQSMSFTEIFTALEQGVVDAQENPMSLIKAQGFYEVQKYIVESNHMFTSLNLGMNKKFYDDLTEQQKKIIDKAALHFSEESWDMVVIDNKATKKFFIDNGVTIITPSKEFSDWNQNAMKPLYENLYKKYDWSKSYVKEIKDM